MAKIDQREKFTALRNRYLQARAAKEAMERELSFKYGGSTTWASRGEKTKLERLRNQVSRAGDAFFAHVTKISPRYWGSGVPFAWVCGSLTYEDAIRPTTESLSVVPPLGYGSTVPLS